MCYAQLLQVVNACGEAVGVMCAVLCQGYELSLVLYSRLWVDREVTVMHLVYDSVFLASEGRRAVGGPSFRVCLAHVDYCSTLSVDTDSFGVNAGILSEPCALMLHLEGVEPAFIVALKRPDPFLCCCLLPQHDGL